MLTDRIETVRENKDNAKTEKLLNRANGRKIATVFGSSRLAPGTPAFQDAETAAGLLAKSGYAVLTGGGPGIMAAANKGAYQAGGISLAACIRLPFEEKKNPYVTASVTYETFAPRKNCLMKSADAFLVYPGGYGTCDELFEVLTLQATGKQRAIPIILIGRDYWKELAYWLNTKVMRENQCISKKELNLFHVAANAEEAIGFLEKCISAHNEIRQPSAPGAHPFVRPDMWQFTESAF